MEIKHAFPPMTVFWSTEDAEYVARCDYWPTLSWLHKTPWGAIKGLSGVIAEAQTIIDELPSSQPSEPIQPAIENDSQDAD